MAKHAKLLIRARTHTAVEVIRERWEDGEDGDDTEYAVCAITYQVPNVHKYLLNRNDDGRPCFIAKNGFKIFSQSYPEYNGGIIYLRGTDDSMNESRLIVPDSEYDDFCEAIDEFNYACRGRNEPEENVINLLSNRRP